MSAIKVSIHSTGSGTDALTGKSESEGLTVSFENEAPCFVSWKSFKQLLSFKTAQNGNLGAAPTAAKPEPKPAPPMAAVVGGNGPK